MGQEPGTHTESSSIFPLRQPDAEYLRLENVEKHFGGTTALSDVSLSFERAEVHCLVGENGAGKSTLGKIIAGVHRPDSGRIMLNGRAQRLSSPRAAISAGISFIAQELSIIPARSVVENVFLDAAATRCGLVSDAHTKAQFHLLQERCGFDLDGKAKAGTLRLADLQKVEIMRAIARDADLVVMDEPTAALGPADTEQLLNTIRDLRSRGVTVVFVTHFLSEALAVADRVTVLKDGRVVRTSAAVRESASSLIESMLGRPLSTMFPVKSSQTHPRTALSVTNLARSPHFEAVSLQVGIGEIVGIAGLAGSGRTELARAIVGVDRADSGTVSVGQITGRFASPRSAQAAGLVMIPESRKDQGLILRANVLDNVCLPHLGAMSMFGFMSDRRQRRSAAKALTAVAMDPSRLNSPVAELSGGNQQKVLFAKWLMADPSVVIADEPTRGVDVGARAVIYQTLRSLANQGTAILFISSDLEEVIGFADRVLVMRSGRLVAQLAGEQVTEEAVLRAMLNHDATQEVTTREA